MSFLKGTAIFLAGGFTVLAILSKGYRDADEHPYAENIVFENDDIRVTKLTRDPKGQVAVVTYKEKTETSETEEVTTEES